MTEISAVLAFGAGLLSFLSPCVLPLIPSWLAFIGGGRQAAVPGEGAGRGVLPRTAFFVLGFSAVFVAASIVFSSVIIFSGLRYMDIAAGIIIMLFGLNVLFDFLKFLNYEKRFRLARAPGAAPSAAPNRGGRIAGFGGAFLVGAAFGAGWTPCVGPILAGILLMAGQSGRLGIAVLYLVLYSAGLGLPFLAAAFFFGRFLTLSGKIKNRLPLIQKISGVLLILIGILILSGRFQALAGWLQKLQTPLL